MCREYIWGMYTGEFEKPVQVESGTNCRNILSRIDSIGKSEPPEVRVMAHT